MISVNRGILCLDCKQSLASLPYDCKTCLMNPLCFDCINKHERTHTESKHENKNYVGGILTCQHCRCVVGTVHKNGDIPVWHCWKCGLVHLIENPYGLKP